jgi:hypothetical protein
VAPTMHFLLKLSSPQLIALVKQAQSERRQLVALLPVGSIEQHGPLLPLGTDSLLAEGCCQALAQRWSTALPPEWLGLILPTFHYTNADSALDFSGTISVRHRPWQDLFHSIMESLLNLEVMAIVFLSGHAPNDPKLIELAFCFNQSQVREKGEGKPFLVASLGRAMEAAYPVLGLPFGRHSDWLEVCLAYHCLGPELIDMQGEAFQAQRQAGGPVYSPIPGIPVKDRSPSGVLGVGWPEGKKITELAPQAWQVVFDSLAGKVESDLNGARSVLWPKRSNFS